MRTEFFLGANSAGGFYSLYDEFCREKGGYFYLIKGGPGGGKSSFMRALAETVESMGYDTEIAYCSGDPESLDSVYITSLGVGWIDATSPHVTEPEFFGVCSCYVNLGQFCSRTENQDIEIYTKLYKEAYDTAYSYLKAADCVKSAKIHGLCPDSAVKKAKSRAKSAVKRELGSKSDSVGSISLRFISGISCKGEIVLKDSIENLCKHVFLLDNRFGLEQFYLQEVIENCGGERLIVCPSPINPQRLEAVLIPEKGLGFVSASLLPEYEAYRHIRLDALITSDVIRAHRSEIRNREKLYRELIDTACGYLKQAKEYHDLLEQAYHPYIDFPALTEFTEREIEKIII